METRCPLFISANAIPAYFISWIAIALLKINQGYLDIGAYILPNSVIAASVVLLIESHVCLSTEKKWLCFEIRLHLSFGAIKNGVTCDCCHYHPTPAVHWLKETLNSYWWVSFSGKWWRCHAVWEPIQLEQDCQCAVCRISCRSGIFLLRWQKLRYRWWPGEFRLHFEK